MTQVAGTKTANVVFIYNAIEYCSEQTVETSKIIHLKINYVHIVYFLTDDDVMDLVVVKPKEGVVHIEVVADSVRSLRTSTKSGPHRIHAGMFNAKHFLSQPVFTVLSIIRTRYNNYTLPI